MRAVDLTFTPQGLHVQQAFHKSEAWTRARSAFLVPVHPAGYTSDPPLLFLRAPTVTARHYIDARLLPSAAASEFFGGYISDWSGFPGPARKGGYG
ncbi:hypothetical protein I4F81_001123 [Pyropia yezoensis]|uniref:Uncharacterized protein n=1 Tax=Pyropia yezoensis TaxID=2788 RepID=A0ACC3BM10_PYRYE|nr:hypothetical protein I4F81_001123 [Neopyropia yezoensis]